ncbi:MAG: energy-coupling factor transporter ATPase [Clostridiaceae bacterium]
MNKNIIECKDVTYKYVNHYNHSENYAIRDINLNVNSGEFLVVLGRNGSGKSTLAKHFNGILTPFEGCVYIEGLDTRNEENIWIIRKNAGMVFQNPDNQIVATIVEEDVAFGPENLGVNSEEIKKRVEDSLKRVDMYQYKDHAPHMLSGGQKQRVAIAGILAMEPKCIIFDESTAMLDPSGRKEVMNTIVDLHRNHGITIILITHHMEEATLADRIIVIDRSRIILEGKPKEVFSQVDKMKEIGLDVPQITELANELIKEGINLPKDILSIDEMVEALCQLR